jgi:hypothetical protein
MSSTALTQQNAIAVPFDNTTVAGSPIEVTGNLSVREVIAGNEVESWWEGSVVGKNISNKPILLLIGDFTEIGPHSDTGTRVIIDSFFYQRVIQPEATFPLVRGGMRHYGECCINPLDESNDPKFDFRVLFVQFLDGSTFGDPTLGKDVLADRTSTLHGLRELARTYLDDGELKFQTQLEQAQGVEFYGIRRTKEQKGVGAAVTEVREMLAIGEQHRATLGQQATK